MPLASISKFLHQSPGYRAALIALAIITAVYVTPARSQDWKSGQDSPVHDSDRLYPLGAQSIVLQNDQVALTFDQRTGALLNFTNKTTGWHWQVKPSLGESFNIFVPTADRSYNPILGARNTLASFQKSADGTTLELVWSNLLSEYQGRLDITLHGTVHLDGDNVRFEMKVENHSSHTIASLSWPIIGSIAEQDPVMKLSTWNYGNLSVFPLWNPASDSLGYYGTDYPTRILDGRFILVSTPDQEIGRAHV